MPRDTTPARRRAAAKGASGTTSKKEVKDGDAAKALKALKAGDYSPELAEAAGFHTTRSYQRPTTGRIVLFHDSANDAEPEPAIIAKGSQQHDGAVSLVILGETGTRREQNVPMLAKGETKGWSWPSREEPYVEFIPMTAEEVQAELKRQEAASE
jgi:hypothetical protein